jgi:hypothetical protein
VSGSATSSPPPSTGDLKQELKKGHGRLAQYGHFRKNGVGEVACSKNSLGGGAVAVYLSPVMTRSSIEFAVQIFLVSLVVTFAWAFYKLMTLIGWW